MGVVGIAWRLLRPRHGSVRGARVVEARDEIGEALQRLGNQRARPAAILGQRDDLAGRIAAGEAPIFERRHGGGGNTGKAAAGGDGRFERQLRREAELDILGGGHEPGLVVDQHEPAIALAVETVGLGGKLERAGGAVEDQAALDLAPYFAEEPAALTLARDEPSRDALEARPPEGAHAGTIERRAERRGADGEKLPFGVGRQRRRAPGRTARPAAAPRCQSPKQRFSGSCVLSFNATSLTANPL